MGMTVVTASAVGAPSMPGCCPVQCCSEPSARPPALGAGSSVPFGRQEPGCRGCAGASPACTVSARWQRCCSRGKALLWPFLLPFLTQHASSPRSFCCPPGARRVRPCQWDPDGVCLVDALGQGSHGFALSMSLCQTWAPRTAWNFSGPWGGGPDSPGVTGTRRGGR